MRTGKIGTVGVSVLAAIGVVFSGSVVVAQCWKQGFAGCCEIKGAVPNLSRVCGAFPCPDEQGPSQTTDFAYSAATGKNQFMPGIQIRHCYIERFRCIGTSCVWNGLYDGECDESYALGNACPTNPPNEL